MEDLNRTLKENQLPEVESLPDGFVDGSSGGSLPKVQDDRSKLTNVEETSVETELVVVDNRGNEHLDAKEVLECKGNDVKTEESAVVPGFQSNSSSAEDEPIERIPTSSERAVEGWNREKINDKSGPSLGTTENENKPVVNEVKRKNAKRNLKSEKEFLEFTLKYQQVISERDSAIAVRDKLESLCRELQRQNKMLMDECKRVSSESQNLRLDISNKFQDAIKEVSDKLEGQKDECISQLKENEMLRIKLKQLADQYTLSEEQHAQKLKQKTLELQLADLKLKQQEEKLIQEQSQMKLYAEQVSQLLTTEKNLRLQLTADGEKFQQFQEALLKSNEVFETFKQEIEKMAKSIKELRKENESLKSKSKKSDISLIELVEEREHLKKQLEKTRNQKEKLEALCRSLQAERKANSAESASSEVVTG